jgi:hypothetical protein
MNNYNSKYKNSSYRPIKLESKEVNPKIVVNEDFSKVMEQFNKMNEVNMFLQAQSLQMESSYKPKNVIPAERRLNSKTKEKEDIESRKLEDRSRESDYYYRSRRSNESEDDYKTESSRRHERYHPYMKHMVSEKKKQEPYRPESLIKECKNNISNYSAEIMEYYNHIPKQTRESRNKLMEFPIINFNNFIKTVLISACSPEMHESQELLNLSVWDFMGGKAGDCNKWRTLRPNLTIYVCTDFSHNNIMEARDRCNQMISKRPNGMKHKLMKFDCQRLNSFDLIINPPWNKQIPQDIQFHVVSCQFAIHYAFENPRYLQNTIRNISRFLVPGGTVIFTFPNSNYIKQIRDNMKSNLIGNQYWQLDLDPNSTMNKEESYRQNKGVVFGNQNLYGQRYLFSLGSLYKNVHEFIAHDFELERVCKCFGLNLLTNPITNKPFNYTFNEILRDYYQIYKQSAIFDLDEKMNIRQSMPNIVDSGMIDFYKAMVFVKESLDEITFEIK